MKKILSIVSFLVLIVLFGGCVRLPVTETRPLLGTQVSITIHAKTKKLPMRLIYQALDSAFVEIQRVQSLADWDQLSKLNGYAGYDDYYATEELIDLINLAYDVSEETGGAYRPDIGPLIDLWGFRYADQRLPENWEVDSVLALVDSTVFSELDSGMARLDPIGASIDLGGLAKGYAVDKAVWALQSVGVSAGIVEAGGDLRCFGKKPGRKKWRIAVRDPRNLEEFYTYILIDSGAVATSGDYENYFEVNGGRYHHLLDPSTGYPSRRSVSCTVIAPTCTRADGYSTAFFVAGPNSALQLARTHKVETLVLFEEYEDISAKATNGFLAVEDPGARKR